MIQEAYVSEEIAKLLKEKGFNEKCIAYYQEGVTKLAAPTHQMTMAWLREEHNIIIVVEPYMYNCVDSKTSSYIYSIWCGDNYDCKNEEYNSYEKAVEAALKYTLDNLV